MNTSRTLVPGMAVIAFALLALPAPATAQDAPLFALPFAAAVPDASAEPQAPRSQGPMKVEKVQSGFLVTPSVKFTEFDHKTSELVGADAGWLAVKSFFIGGGGYWLANGGHDSELAYGGLVVGFFTPVDRPLSFGVKTLFGGGSATVTRSVLYPAGPPSRNGQQQYVASNVRYHDHVGIIEPEANAVVRFSDHVRFTIGGGYRWAGTGYYYGYYGYDGYGHDVYGGWTGTVGVQIGGGS